MLNNAEQDLIVPRKSARQRESHLHNKRALVYASDQNVVTFDPTRRESRRECEVEQQRRRTGRMAVWVELIKPTGGAEEEELDCEKSDQMDFCTQEWAADIAPFAEVWGDRIVATRAGYEQDLIAADGGGMDDGPDQDPMVPSSRVIVVPGFDAIGEHTGAGHNRNIVMPFGGESPGSEGPES
ncbi:hypothetical protein M5K25_018047 [Dendrobium thyrsiflorum]|uniref:Uncharacterized protein n=1 Tax=Dendrobium thyrsiflorum TaxID=117978 RepID=A0ABD0UHG0_DENTH